MHKLTFGRRLSVYMAVLATLFFLLMPVPAIAGGTKNVCETSPNGPKTDKCDAFVETYLNPAIVALTALVGIGAVLSIIIAGIQYSSSADDPGTVTKAKQRIFNTILGLIAYIFLLAFLNYLIPGGIY